MTDTNSRARVPALPLTLGEDLGGSPVLPQPLFPHLSHAEYYITHRKHVNKRGSERYLTRNHTVLIFIIVIVIVH